MGVGWGGWGGWAREGGARRLWRWPTHAHRPRPPRRHPACGPPPAHVRTQPPTHSAPLYPTPSASPNAPTPQVQRRRSPGQRGAALVVGAADWQRDLVLQHLGLASWVGGGGWWGEADPPPPPDPAAPPSADVAVLSADTPAPRRSEAYAHAGAVFVTTRVLCVDLLTGACPGEDVAGLLVLRAHRSTPDGGDAFCARLVRRAAPGAWVRAVSDTPSAFARGFGRAEAVMRALGARRLHLWPRWEAGVKADLAAADARTEVSRVRRRVELGGLCMAAIGRPNGCRLLAFK